MKSAWGLHMLLWTLLLGVAAMGCAGSRTGLSAMTLAEEWALGAKLHERLALSNAGGSQDSTYLVAQIERLLAPAQGDFAAAARPWTAKLVLGAPFLATTLPGGVILVDRKLVTASETYGEFLGILAVQVAHGLDRHAAGQVMGGLSQSALRRLLRGEDDPALDRMARNLISADRAPYSLDDRNDADRIAIALLYKSDIDPMALVEVLERMQSLADVHPDWRDYARLHPVEMSRTQRARSYARSLPYKETTRNDPGWSAFQARFLAEEP